MTDEMVRDDVPGRPAGRGRVDRLPSAQGLGVAAVRHELPAVVSFRLRMGGRARPWAVPAAVAAAGTLVVGVPVAGALAQPLVQDARTVVTSVLPAAWAFFFVSAVVSALGAAGGRELMPRAHTPAFPVSPATDHAGALLLTPLNLAWSLQALGLLAASGVYAGRGDAASWLRAWLLTLAWIAAATCAAQFLGWLAEVGRTVVGGELTLRLAGLLAVSVAVWVVATGRTSAVVDDVPTRDLFLSATPAASLASFVLALGGLLAIAGVTFVAAVPVVSLLARRPPTTRSSLGASQARPMPPSSTDLGHLSRLDRRLVLRSPPLRRGLTVLTALPFVAVALVPLPWSGITVLPALVAAAAGLLYGVNAFALDGPGAVWRDSLPQPARLWLDARMAVLAQVCGACVITVTVVAAVRTPDPPTVAEVVGVACAGVVAVVQVLTRCARWSVSRPHPAQLRQPRDVPAPPVTLAGYSVRLSVAVTLSSVLFSLAGGSDVPAIPVALTVPFLASAVWSLRRTYRAFDSLDERARVTATVSGS